jgi:hypothetical protein
VVGRRVDAPHHPIPRVPHHPQALCLPSEWLCLCVCLPRFIPGLQLASLYIRCSVREQELCPTILSLESCKLLVDQQYSRGSETEGFSAPILCAQIEKQTQPVE